MHPLAFALGLLGGVYSLSGCALTSKADALNYRYFTVDPAAVAGRADAGGPARSEKELRIGRVTASGHLRTRIVYRTSPVEVGVYDDLRWTERPDEYLRRALAHALFDDRGLTQVVAGAAPTLDVELLAFEEIRRGDERVGRVSLHFALHDERAVLVADTITIEVPATGAGATDDVVASISSALTSATAQLADEVTEGLDASARRSEKLAGESGP